MGLRQVVEVPLQLTLLSSELGRVDNWSCSNYEPVLHTALRWANTSHFSQKNSFLTREKPPGPFKKLFYRVIWAYLQIWGHNFATDSPNDLILWLRS